MNIDQTEIQHLVDTTGVRRTHLYTSIHKALRARMTTVLGHLGELDAGDPAHCREVIGEVVELLDALHGHLETENTQVHPAIEARCPGALGETLTDHAMQQPAIARLRQHAQALLAAGGEERAAYALFLYRELALFVADNLAHMHVEETHNHALLWSAYSDAELQALHAQILATLPAEKMAVLLPWIIAAVSPDERGQMFCAMRETAPLPAFEAALALARSCLSCREWGKLCAALGVAPVPGLVECAAG